MDKKKLLLFGIPVAGLLIVANLLYFWLAPNVGCKFLVYGFCFGCILFQCTLSIVLHHYLGIPKTLPVIISGSAFSLGTLVAGGMLLALNAPSRTALYFLLIFSILYLICVGYLSCAAAHELLSNAPANQTRLSVRERVKAFFRELSPRRSGETAAQKHVRNKQRPNRSEPASDQLQSSPPPLPERQI